MLILLFSLLLGWLLASVLINLVHYVLNKFINPIPWQLKVLSTLIVGTLGIIIIGIIPSDLINHTMDVYCSGDEESKNPYLLKLSSEFYKTSFTFDMRSVFDVTLLGFVGKTTVSAIKASPPSIKAAVAASTALSSGTVALGFKFSTYGVQQSRLIKISRGDQSVEIKVDPNLEQGGTQQDVEDVCNNLEYSVDSPFEEPSILEVVKNLLTCVEILSIVCLFNLILLILFILVKFYGFNKLERFNNKLIQYWINLLKKSSNIYIYICSGLILFNLSWILYFTVKLIEIVNNIM